MDGFCVDPPILRGVVPAGKEFRPVASRGTGARGTRVVSLWDRATTWARCRGGGPVAEGKVQGSEAWRSPGPVDVQDNYCSPGRLSSPPNPIRDREEASVESRCGAVV